MATRQRVPTERPFEKARRPHGPRAFSLFELLTVVVIIGLISGMAITKFGHDAYGTADAAGFTRRVALDLAQAKRRAIATGDDHYLQFNRDGGVVVSYALYRDASGGAYQADDTIAVPSGTAVTTASDTWTFDFSGALTTSGASSVIRIDGANFYWELTVFHATGSTSIAKTPQP